MFWIFLFVAVLSAQFFISKRKERQAERATEDFIASVIAAKRFPVVQAHVLLNRGEEAYFEDPDSVLYEPHAVRHYQGGSRRIRVAKGFYVGGSSGRSFSTQELQRLDSGRLVLTNLRVIFAGANEHRSVEFDAIDAGTIMPNALRLSVRGKSKPLTFRVANPMLAAAMVAMLKNPEAHGLDIPAAGPSGRAPRKLARS